MNVWIGKKRANLISGAWVVKKRYFPLLGLWVGLGGEWVRCLNCSAKHSQGWFVHIDYSLVTVSAGLLNMTVCYSKWREWKRNLGAKLAASKKAK